MNEQLPPIDSDLRRQLARRIAGRLPEGLTEEVSAALDQARDARVSARWTRPAWSWSSPRLAGAGVAVALVAIIVAAVVLPAAHSGPTTAPGGGIPGYPAERALTAAELSAVMAGPALATNTTLVATVTIQSRMDVCPMNRYPTIGVIEGMSSQVCVLAATVDSYTTATYTPGVFAFRYLAPGYLGLIGEITPASSLRIAFHAADDWPPLGKTFLVEGYLGAENSGGPCVSITQNPGDLLMPNGSDLCGYDNWLGDDPTAPGIAADDAAPSSAPSYDPASLRGNARHVEAGGMRQIDAIGYANAVRGVFVVQAVFGGCPGDRAWSNRGCNTWLVMAKVSEVTVPEPRASASVGTPASPDVASYTPGVPVAPSPVVSEAPHILGTGLFGPGNRPLTVAELAALWAANPGDLGGRIAVVEGPVPGDLRCVGAAAGDAVAPPAVCRLNVGPIALDGYWAVVVGGDGQLSIAGQVSTPSPLFVYPLAQALASTPAAGRLVIVDAWLDWANDCDTQTSIPPCQFSVLTAAQLNWMHMRTVFPDSEVGKWVQPNDAYSVFGTPDFGGAVQGPYLVDPNDWTILARLEPAVIP